MQKQSGGLAAVTEASLAQKAGHLEMLRGGKSKKDGKDGKEAKQAKQGSK